MLDRQKNFVMAALFAKQTLPTKAEVQKIKKGERLTSLRMTLKKFGVEEPTEQRLEVASEQYRRLRKLNDKDFAAAHPILHQLWLTDAVPRIYTGGAQGQSPHPAPDRKALLKEYNRFRRLHGLKKVGQGPLDLIVLQNAIKRLADKPVGDKPKITKLPTAIAEGAYNTQRHASVQLKKANGHNSATEVLLTLTLGDIASSIGLTPRQARIIARKNKSKISKLELKDEKYKFAPSSRAAVVKVLQS